MKSDAHLKAASLLLALFVAACGAPAAVHSPGSATRITPLAKDAEEGTLVAAVLGYPRDIEYSVNGVRIETAEEIPWWADARLELQLEPGTYRVEATYRVRAFSGAKTTARIATSTPVSIRAGAVTYLLADLAKDWRGVPAFSLTDFRVVDEATFTRRIAAARAAPPVPEVPVQSNASAASDQAGITILRGSEEGVSVETQAPSTESPSIVIRGDEVLPPGTEVAPTTEAPIPSASAAATADTTPGADAMGLPPAAGPAPQVLLDPGASAPPTLALRLESDPAGARVFVDDRDVGVTPVEVRMEPTADHVIRFTRAGCSEHVRFLSAAGWEKGRSTTLVARLECP